MIAFVCEDGHIDEWILEEDHVERSLFQTTIVFVYTNQNWYLKLPRTIRYQKKEKIEDGNEIILMDENTGSICKIDFYLLPKEHYQKYAVNGTVKIGNTSEDDISFPETVQIDIRRNFIMTDAKHIALNGHTIQNSSYQIGDVLLCRNLKIILGPDFIMVRDGPMVQHLSIKQDLLSLQRIPSQRWTPNLRITIPDLPAKWELKDPVFPPKLPLGNMAGMILPSVMMLSSTFLIGLFGAYRSYENGRELADILPTVLMPGMMLLSTLCSHPIVTHFQKQNYRKETQKQVQKYCVYLSEETQKIHKLQTAYFNSLQQVHISIKRLLFLLEHHIEPTYGTPILLGMIQKTTPMEFTSHTERSEEEVIKERIAVMKQNINRMVWVPLCLNPDTMVWIEGAEMEQCFLSLLIQASYYCSDTILFTDQDFLDRYPFLLRLPGLSDLHERRIYINDHGISEDHHGWIFQTRLLYAVPQSVILSQERSQEGMLIHADHECWYCENPNNVPVPMKPNWCAVTFPSVSLPCSIFKQNRSPSFLDLHQVKDAKDLNIKERWHRNQVERSRCASIGWSDQKELIQIDLSEEKNGPHGLIAGTTGSGKSELILTILLSLMVNYSPEDLQIAFIDFKGGGASHVFEVLERPMPHIVGSLSNLDSSSSDRVLYALKNECIHRQKIFQETGSHFRATVMNIYDYRTLQKRQKELPCIADLVIVVDEFAELKAQSYDMLNQLISIARIGRSLGIHLILSTQKPSGVVNDQIWANSRFKICMKVSEKQDSMEILHDPSAFELQQTGEFILECDGHRKKGICGYSGFRRSLQPIQLETILPDGSVDQSYSSYGEYAEPEILPVCREIIKCWKGRSIHPLWLDAKIHCSPEELIEQDAIGILDDYYHQKQIYYQLRFDGKNHMGILAPDLQEKNALIHFIEKLIQKRNPEILLFQKDQEDLDLSSITTLKDPSRKKMVIIPDTSRFYEKAYAWNLHDLLEHSQEYNLQFIFFLNQSSSMPYRDQSFLHDKLCLKNDSLEEMTSFLGTRVRKRCEEKKGLMVREHLLEITLASMEEYGSAG